MEIGSDTRVFVIGCGGMLGKAVFETFSPRCDFLAGDIDLNEPWLEYADVRDLGGTRGIVLKFNPDLIMNLAALTDLEYCELNPDEAWKTNGLGAENMALISRELDIPMIHISTAGIFDGSLEYYNDFDRPDPLSVYGKSKYYAETAVQGMLNKFYVFRAGWMMGGGPSKDKKFINKIYKQIAAGEQTLRVVDDKLGTPTYTVDFARSMLKIIETDYYGLYNMVCGGSCSRYDAAVEFVRLLRLEERVRIEIVESAYFENEYFAPRPRSEKLVNLKLDARGINFMRDWRECLAEYSREFAFEAAQEEPPIPETREAVLT